MTPTDPVPVHPAIPDHFPFASRLMLELYHTGLLTNVESILIEPDYGYTARLTYNGGARRITYGNDFGLNTSSAAKLANDKGHTKFVLREMGVNCPDGKEFLLPWWDEVLRASGHARTAGLLTTEDAETYINGGPGYPVYVKPVDGSKGINVYKVDSFSELREVFNLYEVERVRVATIEKPVLLPDYRMVVMNGELLCAYRRDPLAVRGNGRQNIAQLLAAEQGSFLAAGRGATLHTYDQRLVASLKRQGYDLMYVPDAGAQIILMDVSNLSAGGSAEDVTPLVHPRWAKLAVDITANFNLRLCGVDLACSDVTAGSADYSVLEVNAAPGLGHYAATGETQKQLVRQLYIDVLNAIP
jgi:D-alanine-D-alanine ligase-like ATP-grasp enzyme